MLAWLWPPLFVVNLLWVVGFGVFVILEKRKPVSALAWISFAAAFPFVSLIAYYFIGPKLLAKKKRQHTKARLTSKATFEHDNSSTHSSVISPFGRMFENLGEGPPTPYADLKFYHEGQDTTDAILNAIAQAKHHIHLEYYIFSPGHMADAIKHALSEKAKQGVAVRLLVDALGSAALPHAFLMQLERAGAEVAVFNETWFHKAKLAFFQSRKLNFRTHRKIIVIDGEVAFTGGMNIDDCHDARYSTQTAWRDSHLKVEGEAAYWLDRVFFENWHYSTGKVPPKEAYARKFSSIPLPGESKSIQILSSGPDDVFSIHKATCALIYSANHTLRIVNPYFIPDDSVLDALLIAAARGVQIEIIVPHKGDSAVVDAASRSFFDELTVAGIKIYQYTERFIHAKWMVADQAVALIGTANMDNRSFRLNFEVAALIIGSDAMKLHQQFDVDLASCKEVPMNSDASKSIRMLCYENGARLFAPLL